MTDWATIDEHHKKLEQILTVHVYRRPNLRNDEMTLYLGYGFLIDLFDHPDKDMSNIETVVLQFPERWLNILEQRALYDAVVQRCPNMKSLHIATHSVYIIQCTPNKCCFIISSDDDNLKDYPEVSYTPSIRYCHPTATPGISTNSMSNVINL